MNKYLHANSICHPAMTTQLSVYIIQNNHWSENILIYYLNETKSSMRTF